MVGGGLKSVTEGKYREFGQCTCIFISLVNYRQFVCLSCIISL